ncbi:MAG: PilN domain-containing protein [Neisseriaceae bacterium]
MIKLIRVNLLPYREAARATKKQDFIRLLLAAAALALLLSGLLYYFLDRANSVAADRINLLQANLSRMDDELHEFKQMQAWKTKLLAQRKYLESLQSGRFAVAQMMDVLDRIVPKGVQLLKIEPGQQTGKIEYLIHGQAISDSRVALFLNQIGSSGLFENTPVMNEIKSSKGLQQFTITVTFAENPMTPAADEVVHSDINQQENTEGAR